MFIFISQDIFVPSPTWAETVRRLPIVLSLELATDFHQVDSVGHYVLCFLYHCQINHAYFDATGLTLDAFQLFTFQVRQGSIQIIRFFQLFFHTLVVVCFQSFPTLVNEWSNFYRHISKLTLLDGIQRIEVVVDMLQTRFAQAWDAVYKFTGKIVTLVVVQSFFKNGVTGSWRGWTADDRWPFASSVAIVLWRSGWAIATKLSLRHAVSWRWCYWFRAWC